MVTLWLAHAGSPVVGSPGSLVAKAKAASEHILSTTSAINHTSRFSFTIIRSLRCFTQRRVEIEVSLHAAGQHLLVFILCPERAQKPTSPVPGGTDQGTAPPRPLTTMIDQGKTIILECLLPGPVAPFNPERFSRNMQQVRVSHAVCALGIRKICAQPGQLVAQHIAQWTTDHLLCKTGRVAELCQLPISVVYHDERPTILGHAIDQFHGGNLAAHCGLHPTM